MGVPTVRTSAAPRLRVVMGCREHAAIAGRPEALNGIGRVCRCGMWTESPDGDGRSQLVRKPARRA
eukprot:9293410-Alexandrium_andersonii.AAC.1